MPKKKFIVQLTRVPCHAALIVRACQGVNKIRRVGNDQVEFIFRVILAEVAAYNFHPIAPGGRLNILLGLSLIHIYKLLELSADAPKESKFQKMFSSHPDTAKRVARAKEKADEYMKNKQ